MITYSPRLVRAFPSLSTGDRTLKAYGIFAAPDREAAFPSSEELCTRVSFLLGEPQPEDHGLGFMILHLGGDGDYLLLSEWFGGDSLRHRVYRSTARAPAGATFTHMVPHDVIACVWELEVMKFERDAWVRTIMTHGTVDQPAAEAYLAMRFTGWV